MPLFQKFGKECISSASQTKSSEQRKIRQKILDQYPMLEDHLEDFIAPKATITAVKCQGHISLITVKGEIFFFREREGPYFPTLRLLHKYPDLLPVMQVDMGGCKFVIGGANVMCPGVTSAGGSMAELPERAPCQIKIEGKQHAVALGMTSLSTEEIREQNKGSCITNLHYLGDGLWHMPVLE
eukprot:TRINITY_DN38332_c0_g1_i1.p1 TRINITY_DN38332_c0_g1~~TRINITY_DN38332_c0_g1_i1.p1  ORF type:complete len:204 (+),score=32.66 TRINITY_DN38332_c0_g1_i1:65-613(+)